MKAKSRLKIFLQGFTVFHILWYLLAVLIDIRALPRPTQVYMEMVNLDMAALAIHVLASLMRVGVGIIFSLLVGIPTGLLMAYSETWNKFLNPLVYFTYPIPKTALLPVVMLVFGLGDISKIVMIFLITVFVVIVTVRDAVGNISEETYHPVKSLGASGVQVFEWVIFPAILPDLLTNMRLAVGTSLSILFFTEGYGTQYGIGYYILDAWTRISYMDMYAGIVVISLLGFLLFIMVDILEERVCKWKNT